MTAPELLDPEIRQYLEAEQAYTDAVLGPTQELQQQLFREMKGRIAADDASVPFRDGDYLYYRRFATGGEHPLICRRRRAPGSSEEVLFDGDAEAARHAFFRLGSAVQSPDALLLAYTVDTTGAEYYAIHVKELATGKLIHAAQAEAEPLIVWGNDSHTLYYTVLDAHHRPCRVLRHNVGDAAGNDEVVFEDLDPSFYLQLAKTESRRLVLIMAHDHSDTSEVHYLDADRPDARPVLVIARERGVTYDVSEWRGRLIIRTNAGGAEDFKILQASVADPDPRNWREIVPHRPGRAILDTVVFENWLVWRERVEGLPRLVVRRLPNGRAHEIGFDEPAYTVTVLRGFEYDTDILRFDYSSPVTPERTIDYDMATRRQTLRKQQEIPGGHDLGRYVVRRVFAASADDASVPVTLLHARDLPRDGSAPLLLTGYGAYGVTLPAQFNANVFSLVDRGFVYAIAHIRGGGDRGHHWYRDGKLMEKKNSFRDFIAAAETLIAERYTSAGNIVIRGRSAGGMLVGAVANMRPDLFRAVIAEVPFVDVLNTMSDPELPLTPPEWEEWGNPIEDAAACRYIASYCPYDNVTAQAYPHVLATTGLADPRVTFWEPTKWIAKLRALKTDENLALLSINMEAGHAGAAGRFERLREIALVYAFALLVFECNRSPPERLQTAEAVEKLTG